MYHHRLQVNKKTCSTSIKEITVICTAHTVATPRATKVFDNYNYILRSMTVSPSIRSISAFAVLISHEEESKIGILYSTS